MINELTNDEIEELLDLKEMDHTMLKACENGLLLTDNQVNLLQRYNIDASKCNTMSELLYMLDDVGDDEEIEALAQEIAERNYYENTRK